MSPSNPPTIPSARISGDRLPDPAQAWGVPLGIELVILLGLFLATATLHMSDVKGLERIGLASIGLVLLFSGYLLAALVANGSIPRPGLGVSTALAALLGGWYFIRLLMDFSVSSLVFSFGVVALFLALFVLAASIHWTIPMLTTFGWIFSGLLGMLLLWFFAAGMRPSFTGYMANTNGLGALSMCGLFFLALGFKTAKGILARWYFILLAALTLVMIIVSSTRSIWLALLVAGITYGCWKALAARKWLYQLYLGGVFLLISLFVLIFPLVMAGPWYFRLQAISLGVTEKNIQSGRHDLWVRLISELAKKPWIGFGPGTAPSDLLPTRLSAHSAYFQVVLDTGVIGLALLVALLFCIWNLHWRGRHTPLVRLFGAAFIGIVIYQTFEGTLITTNLSLGLILWLVLGIGASLSLHSAPSPSPGRS